MSRALLNRTYIAGYHASEEDDATEVQYFGLLGFDGSWVIERWDTSSAVKTHRFAHGGSDYLTAWENRLSLTYVMFDEAFRC